MAIRYENEKIHVCDVCVCSHAFPKAERFLVGTAYLPKHVRKTHRCPGHLAKKVEIFSNVKMMMVWAPGLGIGFWLRGVQPGTTVR